MSKWVVDAEHFAGYAKAWLNPSGVCPYTGKTADDYKREGFAVLDDRQYDRLVTDWENSLCGVWAEESAEIDSLQDSIKQHMDAAGVDTLAGLDYKITYKAVTSSRLDSKALKADQPELYAKYTKQTTARRFCLA